MELTYRGRAESLVNFYNSIFKTNPSDHVVLGRRVSYWPADGISVFKPEGINFGESSEADYADTCSGANVTVNVVDKAVVSVTPTSITTDTISYNDKTYYRMQAVNSDINENSCKDGNTYSFLLYVKMSFIVPSETSVTFRKIGFTTGAAANAICYQNVPDQSVIGGGSSNLTLSLILAF